MLLVRNFRWSLVALGLGTGLSLGVVQGCDGGLAEQCGLACPLEGVAEGNASISGIASIDAFFGAVVDLRGIAAGVEAQVRAEIIGIAQLLAMDVDAQASLDDLAGQVATRLQMRIDASVDGGLAIEFQPPRCEASLEVTAQAAAACDASVDPGSADVQCEGTCSVSAEVAAQCEAEGTLQCEGQAPAFDCDGTCTGTCELTTAAKCSGTCRGECSMGCAVQDASGSCAGRCDGVCEGTCELEAGGECGGRCEGSCRYQPPSGGCEAGAQAKCDVSGMAEAKCEGRCEGNVQPPSVTAECEASVQAKADASMECFPPTLSIGYRLAAGLDADAQAEFRVLATGLKARLAALLAIRARADILLAAVANLGGAGKAAIETAAKATGDLDLKTTIGLGCALGELDASVTVIGDATADLQASVSAFATITAAAGIE